ncbi:MAG: hypothetical protein DRQ49_05785 [Gammaproteobacteria bacterium]|nr:MAG: hypothetical protein DRQ49_05785 [Gammaproteobacteria bacterium]RKZ74413.1 MAG: hypothetical protein DRQ57_11120 [Gammaproteobacteria bacterium]
MVTANSKNLGRGGSNMSEQFTLRTLFDELVTQNHLQPEALAKIADTFSTPDDETSTPWFISVLIGFGAWMAIIPFIGFLAAIDVLNSPSSAIVVGALLIIGTVLLHYFKRNSLFFNQLALALNLTGQILLIVGIAVETKGVAIPALATWFLEIVLISVYWDRIIRFLGVIIATLAALVLLYDFHLYQGIHVFIVLFAASALWYWIAEPNHLTNEFMASLYKPLGYGFVIAMQTVLLLSILPDAKFIPPVTWWYSTLGLMVVLLMLEYHLLQINLIPISSLESVVILAGTGLVALLLYQSPGIIAAIIVLLLGFQRGNRVLMGLSIIFLTIFFIAFYYHLDITLLMKSITLMSAGLSLLTLRFVFKYVFPLGGQS